jgi:hypothetical protein
MMNPKVVGVDRGRMIYRAEPKELSAWPLPADELVGSTAGDPHFVDREVIEQTECACGARMEAVAFYRPGSYRVFAVCQPCSKCMEL